MSERAVGTGGSSAVFDPRALGAAGDGVALDSPAIQRAIDACAAAGGGAVRLARGQYRCTTLVLRSRVELRLEAGAVLRADTDDAGAPVSGSTPRGAPIQCLIRADGETDIAITGRGAIDGGCDIPLTAAEARAGGVRQTLIVFRDCRDVRLQDVTLRHSDKWTVHLLRCERVRVRGVDILNHPGRLNTDGIDPDGCRDVIITDCHMVCGDDCIVLKSTEGDACENVIVSNCVLRSSTCALKLGTESVGDIRNVSFTNCAIDGPGAALALYLKDGGVYENVLFGGCVIRSEAPFAIVVDHTPRDWRDPKPGVMRNVHFENIAVTGPGRCYVEGWPGAPVANLSLRSLSWTITGGAPDFAGAKKPRGARRVVMNPAREPRECQPYQFIAVHVDGLQVDGVRLAGAGAAVRGRGFLYTHDVRLCGPPVIEADWQPEGPARRAD